MPRPQTSLIFRSGGHGKTGKSTRGDMHMGSERARCCNSCAKVTQEYDDDGDCDGHGDGDGESDGHGGGDGDGHGGGD
eukprot:10302760-Lingulodinium_polyedra.AAC.1